MENILNSQKSFSVWFLSHTINNFMFFFTWAVDRSGSHFYLGPVHMEVGDLSLISNMGRDPFNQNF